MKNNIFTVDKLLDYKSANLGWLFNKDYYNDIRSEWIGRRKENLRPEVSKDINRSFKVKNGNIISYQIAETDISTEIDNGINLKTTYPGLITGIGLMHGTGLIGEIKVGLQFDYTTGLPYIPGSSVKGLLRSVFPYSLKPENQDKEYVNEYRENRLSYIKGKLENEVKLSSEEIKCLEYAIFEGTDGAGNVISSPQRDIFLDAMICRAPSGGGIVDIDFITPHRDPFKDPDPTQFLKVLPGVVFHFSFELNTTYIYHGKVYSEKGFEKLKGESSTIIDSSKLKKITPDIKKQLFKFILLDIGIGAKTNVGYGQFEEL